MSIFGKARYGGEFTKRKYFKLKDGESIFRILPPMGALAEEGRWSMFYNIHYGYKDSAGKQRPFQSPLVKNRKTKMVEVADAALDHINSLKAQLEKAKQAGDGVAFEKVKKLLEQYNLDSNHYLNVIDQQGNIGVLKIRHRAMLALQATIKQLRESGVDPLSVEDGRFFRFRRSGTGLETTFQVDILKEKLTVQGVGAVERDIVHVLTDELIARCGTVNKDGSFTYKEAADLSLLFKRPTEQEVARIVKEGAKAVDEILGANSKTASDPSAEEVEDLSDDTIGTVESTQSEAVTKAAQAPVTQAAAQTVTPATTPAAPAVSLSTPTKTTAQAVSDMSDEDFLKSLGL